MEIMSRDFGQITAEENEILQFSQPIYGFESLKRYVMLSDEDSLPGFVWLQAVDERDICFILMNPKVTMPGYAPSIPADVRSALGEGSCECWVIVMIPEDFKKSTVNLKSPIFVNLATKKAAQVILDGGFSVRCPIVGEGEHV